MCLTVDISSSERTAATCLFLLSLFKASVSVRLSTRLRLENHTDSLLLHIGDCRLSECLFLKGAHSEWIK